MEKDNSVYQKISKNNSTELNFFDHLVLLNADVTKYTQKEKELLDLFVKKYDSQNGL